MNIVLDILRVIANFLLPKDDVAKLPPLVTSESKYYLVTQNIFCKQCGYAICIPIGEIPKELYCGCNGDKRCSHDFETVIDKGKRRLKTPLGEIPAVWHCEELIKTKNIYEGIFYFKDSWWKIKSGKYVYTIHLDKIINTD